MGSFILKLLIGHRLCLALGSMVNSIKVSALSVDGHAHTAILKTDNQQAPTGQHRKSARYYVTT